jgi:hypothetical protein
MRREVGVAVVVALAALVAACGGRARPAGGEGGDGGVAADAYVGDAHLQADGIPTGRPCDMDGGCVTGYTCWLTAPGGYCLVGPPTACSDASECPAGTTCSPLPMSQISGVCLLTCTGPADCRAGYACDYVYLFPGEPGSPRSDVPVCWTAPVCTYGMDQTCNDNPLSSSIHGYCQPDGTCICKAGFELNPATGKCS